MKTTPFYACPTPATALAARSTRFPYHDNTDCAEGQRVRQSGHWLLYEPTTIAETRPRCPLCFALAKP